MAHLPLDLKTPFLVFLLTWTETANKANAAPKIKFSHCFYISLKMKYLYINKIPFIPKPCIEHPSITGPCIIVVSKTSPQMVSCP